MRSLTPPIVALVANDALSEHRRGSLVSLEHLNEIEVDAICWAFEEDAKTNEAMADEESDDKYAKLDRQWAAAERWAIEEAAEQRTLTWPVKYLRELFPSLMSLADPAPWSIVAGMALVMARLEEG